MCGNGKTRERLNNNKTHPAPMSIHDDIINLFSSYVTADPDWLTSLRGRYEKLLVHSGIWTQIQMRRAQHTKSGRQQRSHTPVCTVHAYTNTTCNSTRATKEFAHCVLSTAPMYVRVRMAASVCCPCIFSLLRMWNEDNNQNNNARIHIREHTLNQSPG